MRLWLLFLLGCPSVKPSDDSDSAPETGDTVSDSDDTAQPLTTYYQDADADGYGNPLIFQKANREPSGYVTNNLDCDDGNADINPDSEEICGTGIDEDCDGGAEVCRSDGGDLEDVHPVFYGSADRQLGAAVSGAGDLDGDGLSDLVFSSSETDYVLAVPGQTDAEKMEDSTSVTYWRGKTETLTGYAVSAVGDVDGDGFGDLVIGAPADDSEDDYSGAAALVLGPPTPGFVDLSVALETQIFGSSAYYLLGTTVAPFGDADTDGLSDFLVGESGYGDSGSGDADHQGAVWGFSGSQTGVSELNDDQAEFAFIGSDRDALGLVAATQKDVDGQVLVALGAPLSREGATAAGRVVLFAAPSPGIHAADDADTILTADEALGEFGRALALGDTDDDGYVDLVVGAAGVASNTGAVSLFLGPLADWSDDVESATATILGIDEDDNFGSAVTLASSDADERSDVWIGSPGSARETGDVRLWYGPVSGSLSGDSADAVFLGQNAGDRAGTVVQAVGDVNSDGPQDVAISALYNATAGADGGALYVLLGTGF